MYVGSGVNIHKTYPRPAPWATVAVAPIRYDWHISILHAQKVSTLIAAQAQFKQAHSNGHDQQRDKGDKAGRNNREEQQTYHAAKDVHWIGAERDQRSQ